MKENIVKDKSIAFAIRIINLYKTLCKVNKEFVMSKQILRAGTSIGANIAESECAISRKDFLSKIYISFKECSETKYWLKLLYETEFITLNEYTSIKKDCDDIYRIPAAITKTTREN